MFKTEKNEKAQKNEKTEKNEKTKKVRAVRTNWHFAIMYPDNPLHVKLLDYLKHTVTMAYIKHDLDEDEKKEHWHVLVYLDAPVTERGFKESFGKADGFVNKKTGEKSFIAPAPADVDNWDVCKDIPILTRSQASSNASSCMHYMTHENFESIVKGKTQYSRDDVQYFGDVEKLMKLWNTEFVNHSDIINDIIIYAEQYKTHKEVVKHLIADGKMQAVDYIAGHAYFVSKFFLD